MKLCCEATVSGATPRHRPAVLPAAHLARALQTGGAAAAVHRPAVGAVVGGLLGRLLLAGGREGGGGAVVTQQGEREDGQQELPGPARHSHGVCGLCGGAARDRLRAPALGLPRFTVHSSRIFPGF